LSKGINDGFNGFLTGIELNTELEGKLSNHS